MFTIELWRSYIAKLTKKLYNCVHGEVAQPVEQRDHNPWVVGSSPTFAIIESQRLFKASKFFRYKSLDKQLKMYYG